MTPDDGDLLVVEDEPFLRKAVAASLRFLGFGVTDAENGIEALRLARSHPFDLLILDVMLPGIDGFEMVRRLRGGGNQVPVIFLTAKDARDDKVTGLTIGGDDYLTKPFELEELAARVRTVLRRSRPAAPEPVLSFADLTLDQETYEVRRGGRLIELSPTEFRLLRYFMLNPGRVLTRAQLLSHVWDYDYGGIWHGRVHLRHLPAAQAGQRRAGPDPHPARRRFQPAPAPARQRAGSGRGHAPWPGQRGSARALHPGRPAARVKGR